MNDRPYAQEGYEFMGAVFEVHQVMGGGLFEEIYHKCLELELVHRNIQFESKPELQVVYKEQTLETRYFPDLVLSGNIIVELKAVRTLASEHEAQLLNYMRAARKPVGYLVNFAPIRAVEWKRFVLSEFVTTTDKGHR